MYYYYYYRIWSRCIDWDLVPAAIYFGHCIRCTALTCACVCVWVCVCVCVCAHVHVSKSWVCEVCRCVYACVCVCVYVYACYLWLYCLLCDWWWLWLMKLYHGLQEFHQSRLHTKPDPLNLQVSSRLDLLAESQGEQHQSGKPESWWVTQTWWRLQRTACWLCWSEHEFPDLLHSSTPTFCSTAHQTSWF